MNAEQPAKVSEEEFQAAVAEQTVEVPLNVMYFLTGIVGAVLDKMLLTTKPDMTFGMDETTFRLVQVLNPSGAAAATALLDVRKIAVSGVHATLTRLAESK